MNVASLELCKELCELSGWTKSDPRIFEIENAWRPTPLASGKNYRLINIGPNTPEDIPAYVLGYLLQKLPKTFDGYYFDLSVEGKGWVAEYFTNDYTPDRPIHKFGSEADTPEDAVCKLAIELFKQSILTKA